MAARQTVRVVARPRRGAPWAARNDSSRVGVRELRQNLSIYLNRVKQGESLMVTEHGAVVAMLRPAPPAHSVIERMVADGRATAPTAPLTDRPAPREVGLAQTTGHLLQHARGNLA